MKSFLRNIVLYVLKWLAKRRLHNFKGKIIAVTGSIGKTSTKEAIFKVLNSNFKVKRSKKSMNSEFGLLLTILDVDTGFSSAPKWTYNLFKAFIHSFIKDHSDVLLLEMGVDKPGDMDFLLSIVKPDVAVFTNVSTVHMAEGQFKTLEDVFEEKLKLTLAVKEGGTILLNLDDELVQTLCKRCPKRRVLSYGKNKDANYKISNVKNDIDGVSFALENKDNKYQIDSSILGEHQAYVLTPAFIIGQLFEIPVENILDSLKRYYLPPGRMSVIEGADGEKIIDSSYNSSPEALIESLKLLSQISKPTNRKVAVLGQMNELGEQSVELHKSVGEIVPKHADILIAVAGDSKYFAESAKDKGMNEKNIYICKNVKEAIDVYKEIVSINDILLVKGSQNKVRLERFVKEFMAFPEDSHKILARQEKTWLKKL